MAIKCFKETDDSKCYVESKFIEVVREAGDNEVSIETKSCTIYTKPSIESIVKWWKKNEN